MNLGSTETETNPAVTQLARFIAAAQPDYTDRVRADIRAALIDTLGCILVGVHQDAARKARAAVATWGAGTSPVYGTGLTLPPPFAALVNAVAGHSLDFDDWELPGNTHPSVVLFSAILAIAGQDEISGSGQAILDAYAVGFEVIARIGEAVNFEHYDSGLHSTATLGALGAAAAVSRLMRLDEERAGNALAISVSQAIGYHCQFGSNTKPLQAGFAAKTGVMAAAFAREGLNGQPGSIDGPRGFNAILGHGDRERFHKPMTKIGRPLAISEYGLAIKQYSSCGYTHRLIDCAIELRERPDFDIQSISKITLSLTKPHAAILPFQLPKTQSEALFSAPFCVALGLRGGQVTPSVIAQKLWLEPEVIRLVDLTTLETRDLKDPLNNYDADDPDWVEIETHAGNILRAECGIPVGTWANPLTIEQVIDKFEDNAAAPGRGEILRTWDDAACVTTLLKQFA